MKKFYAFAFFAALCGYATAAEVTDVISASTITISDVYEQQEVSLTSSAVYLVTLKDEGSGPQFKAGSSGIVTTESGGLIKRIEVSWGSKSNEDIEVYGQHTPYSASNTVIGGTLLGTIEFSAGTTTSLDIDGEWEYIGITTTAKKGKAAQFGSMSLTWVTPDETSEEPCDGLLISEVCGDDGTNDGHEDWIELYNPTDKNLDISGVQVIKTDEDGVQQVLCAIADGTTLAPGAYYVVEKGTHFTAGLSNNKNLTVTLLSPLDQRLDMFDKVKEFTRNGSHYKGGSYCLDEKGDGKWHITTYATKGATNVPVTEQVDKSAMYVPVTSADKLADGIEVILVNQENGYVMSYQWDTTKDGAVYLNGYDAILGKEGEKILVDTYNYALAEVKLVDGGDGTWALKFGETNNYLNDSRYLACTEFKKMDFKKNDDPAKGTRATITFNEGGDAEISYGVGGVIKFNLKTPTTSRFFNYDPTDKPDEHLAVTLYTRATEDAIGSIEATDNATTEYYNMQGMRIADPCPGTIVIVKRGTDISKRLIK